jgi:hypothetical protein
MGQSLEKACESGNEEQLRGLLHDLRYRKKTADVKAAAVAEGINFDGLLSIAAVHGHASVCGVFHPSSFQRPKASAAIAQNTST